MEFPELDQWGTPIEKLPSCPRCGEDELGVMHRQLVLCYWCGWQLWKGSNDAAGQRELPTGSE